MRWVVFVFCFMIAGATYAQNCVVEGAWMGNSPGSLSRCCEGLELLPPPMGQMGTRGQCLKRQNGLFCIGENLSGFVYPGAIERCCEGLTKVNPERPTNGVAFVCKKVNCTKENEYINMQSGVGCCEGLVPYMEDPRRIGGAQCVKKPDANCLQEGSPMFVYPGAPTCCRGLSPGRASPNSPVGFADVCLRGSQRPQVNQSEINKDVFDHGVKLYDDPGVSNQ